MTKPIRLPMIPLPGHGLGLARLAAEAVERERQQEVVRRVLNDPSLWRWGCVCIVQSRGYWGLGGQSLDSADLQRFTATCPVHGPLRMPLLWEGDQA